MFIHKIPYRDPQAAFAIFSQDSHAALFDRTHVGRAYAPDKKNFSYIAANPSHVIETSGAIVKIDGVRSADDPFAALARALNCQTPKASQAPVPFAGGAVGWLGYELGGWLEKLPEPRKATPLLPSMAIGIYDAIAAFDHEKREAWILGQGPDAETRGSLLAKKLAEAPASLPAIDWNTRGAWEAELTRAEIERRIARIIDYIRAGDIYQANFTQRFLGRRPPGLDDFMLYRRLHDLSPAPFAAFMRSGPISVASASPELFLRLQDGIAESRPIKGTRPRDADAARDAALARELEESAKDHAENLMIVDLMRNDLGRACKAGSVKVPHLCALESFASVHHLTSVVTGELKPGAGPIDLLRASFPGGSITGAPKIRAMEIIHELEPAPRGVYCGCMGWIGFDQAMEMSMNIRTLTMTGDTILAQAGGGIVADSDPAAEYEESMVKIAPLLRALTGEGR